jgi:hypothetical protein
MGDVRWRCRECGTVNEPGSRACSKCGHWASIFELQDPVGDRRQDEVFEVGPFPDPAPVPEPFFEPQHRVPEQQRPAPQTEASASRRWSRLRWVARLLPVAIFLTVLAVNLVGSFAGAEKSHGVTPEDIQRTSGLTGYPFAGSRACDVYVVPLDRPSEDESAAIARFVARRVHVSACVTSSTALSPEILDAFRHQVNVGLLIDRMIDAFRPVWHKRPSTILGITALDVYWPAQPDWRFAFAGTATVGRTQGYAAVSTARFGSGTAHRRRLETMAMRYVGYLYFGLHPVADEHSALYPTLLGLDDLDRMRPQFSDPPPSANALRRARIRFLRGP